MKILVDSDLAETIPDGTFGGARPPRSVRQQAVTRHVDQPSRWTRAEQDAHYNALADSIGAPRRPAPPRKEAA
ncbi:hypothetical protein ACFWOX_33955 [Streptomyces sp. NPDC058467]|uniref:hypothetical protein n=1 Tax=Streptomyces sp. NPDC058467 TaxID=3346513 RepID=UPI00365244C8